MAADPRGALPRRYIDRLIVMIYFLEHALDGLVQPLMRDVLAVFDELFYSLDPLLPCF
jgi:hypothetical protein